MGPRQSGKTTLVRHTFPDRKHVSLEDLEQRAFAQNDPKGSLQTYVCHELNRIYRQGSEAISKGSFFWA